MPNLSKRVPVEDYLNKFIGYLNRKPSGVKDVLAGFENGFEGWLKMEFVLFAVQTMGLQLDNHDGPGVGTELWTPLKAPAGKIQKHKKRKRVDLWMSNGLCGEKVRFHYVELKTVSKEDKPSIQVTSWIHDFRAVRRIRESHLPDEVMSVLFGLRFTHSEWCHFVMKATRAAQISENLLRLRLERVGDIHVAALVCRIQP